MKGGRGSDGNSIQTQAKPSEPEATQLNLEETRSEVGRKDWDSVRKAPNDHLLAVELLRGWPVPVVGESFYGDSFQRLSTLTNNQPDGSPLEWAEIVIAPENKFSKSGKAVAVFVKGLQVGHISEAIAPIVYDALEFLGGRAKVRARVHLDTSSGSFRWSSVELEMALPPTLATDATNHKVDSVGFGPRFTELGVFTADSNAGSLLTGLVQGDVLVAKVNVRFDTGAPVICSASGVPFLFPAHVSLPPEHNFFLCKELFYLVARIQRVPSGYSVALQTTQDQKIVKVRTANAVSPVGNVLSSKFNLSLDPAGKWTKIRAIPFASNYIAIPEAFIPSAERLTVYFWASFAPEHGDLYTPWGFRGSLYQKTRDLHRQELGSLPSFQVLVRGKFEDGKAKPAYEIDFDLEGTFSVLPDRPYEPKNALTGRHPRVSPPKSSRHKPSLAKPTPTPVLTEGLSKEQVLSRKLLTTHFNYLEDTYLLPCLMQVFNQRAANQTDSSILIGGSTFKVDESSAAKDAAKRGFAISTTSTIRQILSDELVAMPHYQALKRYEEWFGNLGLTDFGVWGLTVRDFDFSRGDISLIPGAALDERPLFDSVSFIADLVGLAESKVELARLFEGIGGTVLDSMVLRGNLSYREGKNGLVAEVFNKELFLGRTPANQFDSLAESARLYRLEEVWVRVDWLSKSRFRGAFSFL